VTLLNDPATLLSAFTLGFLGSAHCLGMCGGLASALGLNARPSTVIDSDTNIGSGTLVSSGTANKKHSSSTFGLLASYNLGRLLSYCLAGLIVGSLGFWLSKQLAAFWVLRYLAATMLILMGLYLGQWFNGILFSEKLGSKIWHIIQPLGRRFIPVNSRIDALCIGLVWGWLPCGLVYSALIWASLEAHVIGSALIMLFFGLGTLPSMLATGYFAQSLSGFSRQRWFRSTAGGLMILFGLWSMPIVQSWTQNVFL